MGRSFRIKKFFVNVTKTSLKNWKSDWGNLVVLIFPFMLAIPFVPKFIIELKYSWIAWLFIIVGFIIGWFQTNYQKESIIELKRKYYRMENERDHLRNDKEAIPVEIIKHLYKHWNLGYNDRITIYRYDLEHFVPIGRYSKNREINKRGRDKYPKDEGFIGKCWRNGYYYINKLPDYSSNEKDYVAKVTSECSIKKGDLRSISMKSKTYFCRNLLNKSEVPIAVIVVESLNDDLSVSKEKLNADLKGFFGNVLSSTVEANLPLGKGDDNE